MSVRTMPASDLRRDLHAVLATLDRPLLVTARGRVRAVLLDIDRYNELLDEIQDLQDACNPEIREEATAAREARRRGETVPLEKALGGHGV